MDTFAVGLVATAPSCTTEIPVSLVDLPNVESEHVHQLRRFLVKITGFAS